MLHPQSCDQIIAHIKEKDLMSGNSVCIDGLVSVKWLYDGRRDGLLNTANRSYQREEVASLTFMQGIMHTLLSKNSYAKIPELHIRVNFNDGKFTFELVDGQQRVTSIFKFIDNEYKLGKSEHFAKSINGKYYKDACLADGQLPPRLFSNTISCKWYINLNDYEIANLFINVLNNTNSMNWQEKRNAILGLYTLFIQNSCRPGGLDEFGKPVPIHPLFNTVFKKEPIKNSTKSKTVEKGEFLDIGLKRLARDAWLSKLIYMYEHGKGKDGCSETKHFDWVESQQLPKGSWSDKFPEKKKYIKLMDTTLALVKLCQTKERRNKLSPQFCIMMVLYFEQLKERYDVKTINYETFLDKWFDVYKEWNRTDGDAPWQGRVHDSGSPWGILSDQFNGSTPTNIATIFGVYDEEEKNSTPYEWGIVIKSLDPVRVFSDEMKEEVWLEQGKVCAYSGNDLPFEDAIGDHYIPHSKGGRTVKENLKVCSKYHNSQKGDMMGEEYEAYLAKLKEESLEALAV